MKAVKIVQGSLDDDGLIQKLAAGHLDALGLIFDRYHQAVRRFLAHLQVQVADLDDLVQVTFMQVPTAAVNFESGRPLKPWLFGLAAIVVKRHRRTLARIARKVAALAREPVAKMQPTPMDLVGTEQSARRIQKALAGLSSKKREVFVMVVMERIPGETVAYTLGIPVGTVWTRLHHARKELQNMLTEVQS